MSNDDPLSYEDMLARRERARDLLAELSKLDCGRLDGGDNREDATFRFLKSLQSAGPHDAVWNAADNLLCVRDYDPEVFATLAEFVGATEQATCGDQDAKRSTIEALAALYRLDELFSARLFNSRIDPAAGE